MLFAFLAARRKLHWEAIKLIVRLNLFILFGFVALSILRAQGGDAFTSIPKPLIEWKYGWQDGLKANTVGSAKNGDPVPKGSSYLTTGYSPDQIATAYGINLIATNGNGTNQSIAIVVAYGNTNIQHDLDVFCTNFGIPSTTIQTYYPNGYPTESPVNNTNWSGWASETSLDVEWAHATAPAAKILLVVDADSSRTDQCVDYAVTNLNANVVSMSFGSVEYFGENSEDTYFQAPGVAYVAAAGDNSGEIDYPAASPNVIGVGGTRLLFKNGVYTESVWKDTGGGQSIYEPFPSYQAGVNTNTNGFDTITMGRGTPDVCADADVYTSISVYFTDPTGLTTDGWIISGGTSASTPIWAGIMARRASLVFSNDHFLDLLYSKQTNFWPCKDITNGQSGTIRAVKGYDLATGLGSPRADQIVTLDSNSPYTGISQTIIFPAIPTKTFKTSPPFKLAATASSKLPVSYLIDSGPATISGALSNTITILGGGTVVLVATNSGDHQYAPTHIVTNIIINRAAQTITFPSLGIKPYSTTPLPLNARASSLLPITYSITNGPASLVGSNTVLTTGVGSVITAATQLGNSDYLPTKKLMSFKVIRAPQKISPFSPIPNQIVSNPPQSFSIPLPTANSGLTVSVAVKSGPATITGNMITLKGTVGTVVLTANQGGTTNNYLPAPQVTTSFKVTAH
jgi:hypothetical protein